MADVGEVRDNSSMQNSDSLVVITLSSDEEEIAETVEDVNYLFNRFILVCRPHMQSEALVHARKKFRETPRDFARSEEIASMLKRYTKEVNKDNAVVYMDSVCTKLANGLEEKQRSVPNHNNIDDSRRDCGNDNSDVSMARDFKEVESQHQGGVRTIADLPAGDSSKNEVNVTEVSDDEVDFVCEIKRNDRQDIPSTSGAHYSQKGDEMKLPKTGKISTKDLTERQKKKLVAKLKTRLKEISQEIKILSRSELTLDEMELADSNYIKENRLKKKFDKTWNKLCKLLGRPPNTGRVVEKRIRASSTGYSIIDKAVERFLNEKSGKFPDYFDIRDLVLKTNDENDLRMSPQVISGIIADVFTDIGNKLQKLREKDLLFNFGSHLLDDFKTDEDPALSSEELLKKLERNRKISKRKLKQVYTKYTHLERYSKAEKKGGCLTSEDKVAKELKENENDNSEGTTTTDEEQEMTKGMNIGSSFSDEESVDSSQPCSSKMIFRNGSCTTNYERHSTSDDESSDTDSMQHCLSKSPLSNCPKATNVETKSITSTTVTCTPLQSKKDYVSPSYLSGDPVNNRDLAAKESVDMEKSPILIDLQDEESFPSNQASNAPVSPACAVPVGAGEHVDNSTSVVNDDCQIIIDSPAKKAGPLNTSQTCDDVASSACSVPTTTIEQKPNIENSLPVLNDNCQIIIDSPAKKAGPSNTSQTCNALVSTSPNEQKPSIEISMPVLSQIIIDSPDEQACSTTNQVHDVSMAPEEKPSITTANMLTDTCMGNPNSFANNNCPRITDSTDKSTPDHVNRTNEKKRKASTELNCDGNLVEKASPRNKRLKTPHCTNENSTRIDAVVALKKITAKEPLKDKDVFNGRNSPCSTNGRALGQIPNHFLQAFREKTLNALKLSIKKEQWSTTVNGVSDHCSVSSTAAESTRQETANGTNLANAVTPTREEEECEVIVIDD